MVTKDTKKPTATMADFKKVETEISRLHKMGVPKNIEFVMVVAAIDTDKEEAIGTQAINASHHLMEKIAKALTMSCMEAKEAHGCIQPMEQMILNSMRGEKKHKR